MSIRTEKEWAPNRKEMEKCGWYHVPGSSVNHFFDGTWTLCQHIGTYHGPKQCACGVPDCVVCLRREDEWKKRNIPLLRDEPDTHHYQGH